MKSATAALTIVIAGLALGLTACGTSAQSRFYTLGSMTTGISSSASGPKVLVGPVAIPAAVDRPEMVVQVPPNGVEVEEFNRWAAPLGDLIARAVAADLAVQLGSSEITSAPLANFNPAYKVTINVQRFDSIKAQDAVMESVWTVQNTAHGKTRSGSTVTHENIQGDSFDAIAAAHSRAITHLSNDIAGAIRSESN